MHSPKRLQLFVFIVLLFTFKMRNNSYFVIFCVVALLSIGCAWGTSEIVSSNLACVNFFCSESELQIVALNPSQPGKYIKLASIMQTKTHVFDESVRLASGFDTGAKVYTFSDTGSTVTKCVDFLPACCRWQYQHYLVRTGRHIRQVDLCFGRERPRIQIRYHDFDLQ